eukprot:g2517.t1
MMVRLLLLCATAQATTAGAVDPWLQGSGLLGDTPRLPPATWLAGASFAGVFTDSAVLQQAPQASALYGVVVSPDGGLDATTLAVNVTLSRDGVGIVATSAAQYVDVVNASYAHWKAVLPPQPGSADPHTVALSCSGCPGGEGVVRSLHDVLIGDVYVCSGQSNMWLPMHFSFSRNATFEAWRRGRYRNIRLSNMPRNAQPDDAWPQYDLHVAPHVDWGDDFGAVSGGGWKRSDVGTYPNPPLARDGTGDEWHNNTIDQFSAACWYFAQTLTDMARARNETEPVIGLIESNWGGTMVEMWQPNATLNAQACANASGGAYEPAQLNRWDVDAGALWNGMVLPLVNMSIRGALWYQGENNVFQCQGGRDAVLGDPSACGTVRDNSGYGCFMANLIRTWRAAFSGSPGNDNDNGGAILTPPDFPFGIVSLAGGTSEGFGNNMGAFRLQQAGGTGLLPTKAWPKTFVAQAFDLGEPGDGAAGQLNAFDGAGAYASARGAAPFTSFFMGGIHPRPKRAVGARLAAAARALVYGDAAQPWTGPVARSCAVDGGAGTITIQFDAALLGGTDAVAVRRSALQSPVPLAQLGTSAAALDAIVALARGGQADWLATSPLEVQYGGTNLTDGVWLPAVLQTQCADGGFNNAPQGAASPPKACDDFRNRAGPAAARAVLPLGGANVTDVTGVRYAVRDNPCCPGLDRAVAPCPPASCPISAYNSTLPAVPFFARVEGGKCSWLSTSEEQS